MSPRRNPKVLTVDRDPDACARVFDCFERARWPVFAAPPGEAVRTIRSVRPDLLVTELQLGGLSGIALLRRSRAYCPNLRAIFLSRHGNWDLLQKVLTAGGDDLLSKPITANGLLRSARKLMIPDTPNPKAVPRKP